MEDAENNSDSNPPAPTSGQPAESRQSPLPKPSPFNSPNTKNTPIKIHMTPDHQTHQSIPIQGKPRQKFRGEFRTAWLESRHPVDGSDLDDRHRFVCHAIPNRCQSYVLGNADDSNPPCSIISHVSRSNAPVTSLIAGRSRWPHRAALESLHCRSLAHKASLHVFCFPARTREHEQSARSILFCGGLLDH